MPSPNTVRDRVDAVKQRIDPDKAYRAAQHPDRPGEQCRADKGVWQPQIDRGRCEGKGDCVQVCPHDVFTVGLITEKDFAALSPLGRLKSRVHGRKTALTPLADACRACGMCVVACPEKAITLVRSVH